jgi:peptide/nickel transport system ATP-binding protein
MSVLIEVKDLRTQFTTEAGVVNAVDGVSYFVNEQEIIGLVGESGSGKSVSQLSTLQLISSPPGRIIGGEVWFEGKDILKNSINGENMRRIRGGKISMIFQEPMTSLNPTLTIGEQIKEMLALHLKTNKRETRERAIELLTLVNISDAEKRLNDYPHQFSGGMRQRVMIAMAMSCNPKLMIADEPTTALDVTTQAQLLELLKSMVIQFKTSLVIVTHNLGIVARYAQRIYVMYAGRIVESGTAKDLFGNPKHPYTVGLLKSVPRLDEPRNRKLVPIDGPPPNLMTMHDYCTFKPRCSLARKCYSDSFPEMVEISPGHFARCNLALE